jgi:hypothetical protein
MAHGGEVEIPKIELLTGVNEAVSLSWISKSSILEEVA